MRQQLSHQREVELYREMQYDFYAISVQAMIWAPLKNRKNPLKAYPTSRAPGTVPISAEDFEATRWSALQKRQAYLAQRAKQGAEGGQLSGAGGIGQRQTALNQVPVIGPKVGRNSFWTM